MKAFFEGIQSLFVDFLFIPFDFFRSIRIIKLVVANTLSWILML
jgi:hypothetical protein